MFDVHTSSLSQPGPGPAVEVVRELRETVVGLDPVDTDAGLVDQIEALERLKSAAAAVQARFTFELDARREAMREARRLLSPDGGRTGREPHPDASLGTEVGLARRESPHEGRRKLRLARALLTDFPLALAALERGDLNERRAEIVVRETADLGPRQRQQVDRTLFRSRASIEGVGDAELRDRVRREAMRLDEAAWEERHARAAERRRVTGRSLGDGMSLLTAVVPSLDLTTIMASLDQEADVVRQDGDERSRAQLMTDLLVARLTGRSPSGPQAVAFKLLVSAETLLGDSAEPGYVVGCGPVPASVARALAADAVQHVTSSIQRLFHSPTNGALIAMESASSLFRGALGEFITLRDQRCRTPWCNAPIRHRDHVRRRTDGGPTSVDNGQGLCEACNYAKESPGWRHESVADPLAVTEIEITTPTGHLHRSRAPDTAVARDERSRAEREVTSRHSGLAA